MGKRQEERHNTVSTAGLFMGGEVGRKDKPTHELSSERSLIQGKKGSENVLEAFNDSQECVMFPVTLERKAESAHPEAFSSLSQFRVQPAGWGGVLPGTQRWAHFPFPVLHLPAPPLCLNRKCGGRGGEGPSLSGRDLWEKR